MDDSSRADLIMDNGQFTTLDPASPSATAVAVRAGKFVAVGGERDVTLHRGPGTTIIDLRGHTVIPGLTDTHMHLIRAG